MNGRTKREILMLNGYRTVFLPDHPRAMHGTGYCGYVYEHILVAEKMLDRPLRSDEVVHHLDDNRSNNREENIIVIIRSQHTKLHDFLRRFSIKQGAFIPEKDKVQGVNSGKSKADELTYCPCGNILQKRQKRFCSDECQKFYSRKVNWPSREELEKDISSLSWLAIGRKYGVSDNAVRNWARKYGLL